jgi:hypothetical protein
MYLTLAGDGAAEAEDQRSLPRKLMMVVVVSLVAMAPLLWAASAQGADDGTPEAVLTKKGVASDDDDDADASGDGTGGGTGTNSNGGTGAETQGNTDRGGQNTGKSTLGETDGQDGTGKSERTQGTGAETQGDSDDGQNTGVKTAGDTDGGGTDSMSGADTTTGDEAETDTATG